ncbi:hypothetical protein HN695_06670 [Candidatus Woesearchaeota archaeon]|jgi:hypothetical protein|nr:hypothetical protein [Candidatus Woesearchaeota archaeon]MBT6040742.1 hypothetical protein [Candidatus Woesearchaeota archaeon]MBT6337463.1 hypothetical protein [Candidatus Woesearchaeota archaeon]MBT7927989.1 hypothetical protein [Candidatus Woesearchaeota archaeon]
MGTLDFLRNIARLKKIARGGNGALDTSRLEQDFLMFSQYTGKRELVVKRPSLFRLDGDDSEHFKDAILSLGSNDDSIPRACDISGAYLANPELDNIVIVSPNQLNADHIFESRSHLNVILKKIYGDGARLLRDFTVHEAVLGEAQYMSGELNLGEISLFPERFKKGPYQVEIKLDTPSKTISDIKGFFDFLDQVEESPKKAILDPAQIERAKKGIGLRERLGSLSRYDYPELQSFKVNTNHCVIKNKDSTYYFLHNAKENRNAVVYFGVNPFEESKVPYGLEVINGEDPKDALVKLVEFGVFDPSEALLEQRITALQEMYDSASRAKRKKATDDKSDYNTLLTKLNRVKDYFAKVINPELRRAYTERQEPEIMEFIVHPASDSPTIHELLPRVSWNHTIRDYHDTNYFIESFHAATEEGRKEIVHQVAANIMFSHHQSQDTNLWLYLNHRELCEQEGISFKVASNGK